MKQHLLATILFLITLNSYAQNQLVINGKVDGKTEGKIYLLNWTGEKPVKIDSATINKGAFHFHKTAPVPAAYLISMGKSRTPIFLFPETEPMSVSIQLDPSTGKVKDFTVSGGKVQTAYNTYTKKYKEYYDDYLKLLDEYNKAKSNKDEESRKKQREKMLEKEKTMSDLGLRMIEDNTDNILSLFFIYNKYQKANTENVKEKLDKVNKNLATSELYKHLNKK